MEPKFRTSFIPKQPLRAQKVRSHGGALGIISLVTLILFLGAIVLSLGTFLYQQYLVQSIDRKNASLERARAAFEPALIRELTRLDARIASANTVLSNHIAPSEFFELLEQTTLKSIRFYEFSYTVTEGNRATVSMKGEAEDFSSVALQSDIFGESAFIEEPIFSNLNIDQEGDVIFDFSAVLAPDLLSYRDAAEQAVEPTQ